MEIASVRITVYSVSDVLVSCGVQGVDDISQDHCDLHHIQLFTGKFYLNFGAKIINIGICTPRWSSRTDK